MASLWPDRPPPSARRNIQLYVHQLRRVLGAETLATDPGGYVVFTGGCTDAAELARLSAEGSDAWRAADVRRAAIALRQGLDLWRGPAYGEFADSPTVPEEALRLEQLRLAAAEQWAEAELASERPAPLLVAELAELARADPYHEKRRYGPG